MNIILIGFMAAGKSTVGKTLSNLLGMTFVDMDDLVYEYTQTQNMHEVVTNGGEFLLRETEIVIAKDYAVKKNQLIATGGGVVLNKIILDYFKLNGAKIIFLHTPFQEISRRLENTTQRPLLTPGTDIKKLYDFRLPLYLHYADEIMETGSQSAKEIAEILKQMITSHGL